MKFFLFEMTCNYFLPGKVYFLPLTRPDLHPRTDILLFVFIKKYDVKEEFIAYLWKNRLLQPGLFTVTGEAVHILHPGMENHDAGPDFMVARVRIGKTLWVGNVEIHVKSSDWLKHKHELNPAYDNIILHVVFLCDICITSRTGEEIPVLETRGCFSPDLYHQYRQLKRSEKHIACGTQIAETDPFLLSQWLNRLLIERLEHKAGEILSYHSYFVHDWEQTLYYFLARNFGFRINAMAFGLLAQRTPLSLLLKKRDQLFVLEALLFGQAGLLNDYYSDAYPKSLQSVYRLYRQLHELKPINRSVWHFARMRPNNFPTIRIAQFAMLLHSLRNRFADFINGTPLNYHRIFRLSTSCYWDTHYHFEKKAVRSKKTMGKQTVENILINTIAPCLFSKARENDDEQGMEQALSILFHTPPENNKWIRQWKAYGIIPQHAGDSQALLQLRKFYCIQKRCLQCAVGNQLLRAGGSES